MNRADNIVALLLEDQDFVFSTEVDLNIIETDITGLPDDQAHVGGTAQIHWRLDIDARSWGIKELQPEITAIQAHLRLDDYSQPDETNQEMEIVYNSGQQPERPADENDPKAMANYYQGFTAEARWSPSKSSHGSVVPTSLGIDLTRRHIIVYFG